MYIKKVEIKNIRAIKDFQMEFEKPAGWHVIIAENGAGKSTLIRCLSAALIGPEQIVATLPIWDEWLANGQKEGKISLEIQADPKLDKPTPKNNFLNELTLKIQNTENHKPYVYLTSNELPKTNSPKKYNWGRNTKGWFSVGYGPFRRFTGGDDKKSKAYYSAPKAGAHLSAFGEDVALTEVLEWLKQLDEMRLRDEMGVIDKLDFLKYYKNLVSNAKETIIEGYIEKFALNSDNETRQRLEDNYGKFMIKHGKSLRPAVYGEFEKQLKELPTQKEFILLMIAKSQSTKILEGIKIFINESQLLPHGAIFDGFDTKGNIVFLDGQGNAVPAVQMSDGYRSVLSLVFELIRQLIETYGADAVFKDIHKGEMAIKLPGVTLIDEVDAHLHPSWQSRIGQWFTRFFPAMQFIVSSHSPLVCRAAENGTIWRLASPGREEISGEITGIEKERLVYGNVLDAYGTELFGGGPVVRSQKSEEMKQRLGQLNAKSAFGKITEEEEKERLHLAQTLSTDDPTGF